MGKKTKRQRLKFPEVRGWKPYEAFSKNKDEILPKEDENSKVDVPAGWKEPKFTPEDNPHGRVFACSSFSTIFPKYREKYLREVWPAAQKLLREHYIRSELDLAESTMEVRTTPKTFDPFVILKARDFIRLMSRSVPLDQAARVLDDDVYSDIIEVHERNKERFVKRRSRLIGNDGDTLKAIELATGCYVLIQGKTVSAIGSYNGIQKVRKIVNDCMHDNIHPAYSIKRLIVMQKLATDPSKANISWDPFLPKVKKKVLSKRWKPKKVREKREYTPFPPAPVLSKLDEALEQGTYFLGEAEKQAAAATAKIRASEATSRKRQSESRALAYLPPEERAKAVAKRSKSEISVADAGAGVASPPKKKKKTKAT